MQVKQIYIMEGSINITRVNLPSPVAQTVASLTADSGVMSSIPAPTFMEIDHEMVICLLPIHEGFCQL